MMSNKLFALLALWLFACSYASPFPESSEEVGDERFLGFKKTDSEKEGIVVAFLHEKTNVNIQIQLKEKDGFRELCLRLFHKNFPNNVVKPCIGIKHEKDEDKKSFLPYLVRIGRFHVKSDTLKLNRKVTTCQNIPLVGERVCFKDFKFQFVNHEKHGKVTNICLTVGLKKADKSYTVCGVFKGKKLVDKNFTSGKYNPEMDLIKDDVVEESE